uniref:CUE domain-containing protein n=1 Tax=Dunaliella tertiolecta TaxID=3047 RepID=A0A7S3QQ05_DUNTE
MEQAISVLLDQDSLLDRLAVIVERSVQQVEEEVAAAAAAAAAQEAARCERAAAPGRRRGGWSGSRPGTYGAAAGARPSPADPNSFPSLPSQHCDRTGRPRALHPRTVPPWKHKGGGMTESWGASETLTGRVKVLQNSDSLSNLAHQHGLHVRDVEALKQLFPTLDNPFLVSTLADVKGDVTAAFDYLLDAGILPGHAPEMDDLFDLGGGNNNNTGSYLAAAASTPDGGKQQGTDVPDPSIWGGQPDGLPFEEKVVRLLGAFEGLDSSLAEFTLRQCNEDLAAAAAFLHECLHADNSASAAAAAQSEAVAAAIARPDSYAGVAELSSAQGPVPEFITDAAGKQTAQAGVSQATHSSSLFNQQQQAAADGSEGGNGQARAAGGVSQEDGGWQTAPVRSNGWKERAGASAKDAADKERSRLQSGKARQIAHIYYNFRNVFFQQANAAYNAGDGKAAAEFSRRGRQYGELAKQFRQASNEEAYKASNLGIRNTFVMDLHGMHVTEALALLERQMDALGRSVTTFQAQLSFAVQAGILGAILKGLFAGAQACPVACLSNTFF